MSKTTKLKLNCKKADELLVGYTTKLADKKRGTDKEYAELQLTWNRDILDRSFPHLPKSTSQAIGIGSFHGALEMALAHFYDKVVAVDHKPYLPRWKPSNVLFHKANIDSGSWKLPERREDEPRFEVCYFIETIEHLLWSPLPLLEWIHKNCHMAVISTPDDIEWPAMEIQPWTRYQHFSKIPPAFPGAPSNPNPMFHTKQYGQAEFVEMLDSMHFRLNEFFRTGEGKHQMVAIVQPR